MPLQELILTTRHSPPFLPSSLLSPSLPHCSHPISPPISRVGNRRKPLRALSGSWQGIFVPIALSQTLSPVWARRALRRSERNNSTRVEKEPGLFSLRLRRGLRTYVRVRACPPASVLTT